MMPLDVSMVDEEVAERLTGSKRERDYRDDEIYPKSKFVALPRRTETFAASGVKHSLHGVAYQWKVLMLLAKRCHYFKYDFNLATEMDEAEKFDDAVVYYLKPGCSVQHAVFLQAKHIQMESASKITAKDLLHEKDSRFSLQKYFKSFRKIRERNPGRNCKYVIYTNIDFGFDLDPKFYSDAIKKLSPLYFKQVDEIGNLLKFSEDDGAFYQLVNPFAKPKTQREAVVGLEIKSKLKSLFQKTSDLKILANEFAEILITGKKVKLLGIMKDCHQVIVNYVIDLKNNKFRTDFLDPSGHSSEAKVFCQTLLRTMEESFTMAKLTIDKENFVFDMTDGFKKKFALTRNPIINDPTILAKELADLITKKVIGKKIVVSNEDRKVYKVLVSELSKLAGHVFVEDKNKTVTFSKAFLKGHSLAGNLQEFRNALISEFKLKSGRDLDKEFTFSFDIVEFESEFQSLPELEATDEDVSDFLENLLFAVNQPNEIKLSALIAKELGVEFNLIDVDLITNDFQNEILSWLKEKGGSFITEKEMTTFFEEMGEKISQLVLIGPTSNYMNKLQEYGITFQDLCLSKLKTFLDSSNENKSILNFNVGNDLTLFGGIKIMQVLNLKRRRGSYIFVGLRTLIRLQNEVLQAFRKQGTDILIIECKSCREDAHDLFRDLCQVIREHKDKKVIFITTGENAFDKQFQNKIRDLYEEIRDEFLFSTLTADSQHKLLSIKISFQGIDIALNEIIPTFYSHLVQTLPLADLFKGIPLVVGRPLTISSDEEFYIARTINQPTINKAILDNKDDKGVLRYYVATSEREFQDLSKYQQNVHWLEEVSDKLIWIKSSGSTDALKPYIDADNSVALNSDKLLQQAEQQRVMLIADLAGTGKSTLLSHLSQKIKETCPSYWVVRINLNENTDALKRQGNKPMEAVDFVESLMKVDSSFEKALFKQLVEEKKVILMMDGFDEVSPTHEETVLALLQNLKKSPVKQIWVTTRPHLSSDLENALQVPFTYSLQPFSECDQVNFLIKYWNKNLNLQNVDHGKLKVYGETLIDKLSNSIGGEVRVVAGIPLQTRMLAEAFEDKLEEFHDSDDDYPNVTEQLGLYDLYTVFFDRRHYVYAAKYFASISEKNNPSLTDVASRDLLSILKGDVNLRKVHQHLALKTLFFSVSGNILKGKKSHFLEANVLFRIGIVYLNSENKPQFVHSTFAEYYAADFLIEQLVGGRENSSEIQAFLLTEIFLKPQHRVVRSFIERLLQEKQPSQETLVQCGIRITTLWKENKLTFFSTGEFRNGSILHRAALENNANIICFLRACLTRERFQDTAKELLEHSNDYYRAWDFAIQKGYDNVLDKLVSWAEEIMTQKEIKDSLFLAKHPSSRRNVFELAVENGRRIILSYLFGRPKHESINKALFENIDSQANVLSLAAANGFTDILQKLRKRATDCGIPISKLNDMLLSKKTHTNIFMSIVKGGHIETGDLLVQWFQEGRVDEKRIKTLLLKESFSSNYSLENETPWQVALVKKDTNIIDMLFRLGTEKLRKELLNSDFKQKRLNFVPVINQKPWHLAAIGGSVEVMDKLLELGRRLESNSFLDELMQSKTSYESDYSGNWESMSESVGWLKNASQKDEKARNEEFWKSGKLYEQTVVHIAAQYGHIELIKYFDKIDGVALYNALKRSGVDSLGCTPLDWALQGEHSAIAEILRNKGGVSGQKLIRDEKK